MKTLNITFIGGGNMAEAMISGLIASGHQPELICVSDVNPERLDVLQAQYGIQTELDNLRAIQHADTIVLAVKPQQVDEVLHHLMNSVRQGMTLISIAAGVVMARLEAKLSASQVGLVRVMPNTPALVGEGMSVLYSHADDVHKERAAYILASSGKIAWVDEEKHLHAVTAVSGSGPAYFFLLAEVMQAAGEALGLPKELAAQLANQTALGSGKMLVESGREAAALRTQVTSPGGTTQAALDEMYEGGMPSAVRKGVNAASKRSKELSA
ncbi:MAG: pyrroline-5-carboxylate reductase [Zetaproteobacteria bacterium]|nr:pyrroline-5-carboxylate reductase [Zetaproteobacteria bacterium]